ncbi:hypothetical protein BU17DRAFT_85436 [Hysterangium stoloniferum]|nr:hypothetical protein BU17DRAFT_85436 [Hysterangium stoloniferum]
MSRITAVPSRSFFAFLGAFRKCVYTLRCISIHELHLSTLSVHGISYYSLDEEGGWITRLASVKLALHIPTLDDPYFATVDMTGLRHCGPLGSGHCNSLTLRVRLPRRDQTWLRVRIDHIQATARKSVPPFVIDKLRENILRAIVLGRVVHLDDFYLGVDTSLVWSGKGVSAIGEADGFKVTIAERTYDFKKLDGILHQHWDQKHGRLAIAVDNVVWCKTDVDETGGRDGLRFRDFVFYPVTIIASIFAAIQRPASLLDLELASGQLKFPRFRHCDQPILKHALQFVEEADPHVIRTGLTEGFMWGAIGSILEMFNAHIESDSDWEGEGDGIPKSVSE